MAVVVIDPEDLVGCTFLLDEQEDGQRFRVHIVECVAKHDKQTRMDPEHVKFKCSVNDDSYEEIISYNKLMDFIQKNAENNEILWRFKRIVGHQGPLRQGDPHYAGSSYNVQVKWENGEITYEPLEVIAADDPITCAVYARDNDLLEQPGWKCFNRLARREKQLLRLVKQAKMHSFKNAP